MNNNDILCTIYELEVVDINLFFRCHTCLRWETEACNMLKLKLKLKLNLNLNLVKFNFNFNVICLLLHN